MIFTLLRGTPEERSIEITLPEVPTKIGVMTSGGVDSSIMLYLLALVNRDECGGKHTLQPFTVPRLGGAMEHAPKVINFINSKLGTAIPNVMEVGDTNAPHREQVQLGINDALNVLDVRVVYVGDNLTPPSNFQMKGTYPSRNTAPLMYVKRPFMTLFKSHVVDLISQLGVEDILPSTHTCTELTVGRCGECFACDERRWGFEQAGKIDPSTN